MKSKATILIVAMSLLLSVEWFVTSSHAANLEWQTSKQDAINLAIGQGKKILLVAGRDT